MIKVLFICHGNICRSPMAEFILKKMLADRDLNDLFQVASAATSTEEIYRGVGNPVYPPARRELQKHGISCEGKRAVLLRREDYDAYDYLIAMDDENIRGIERITGHRGGKIHKLMEYAGSSRDVDDPWYTGRFDVTYRDIETGCEGFLKAVGNGQNTERIRKRIRKHIYFSGDVQGVGFRYRANHIAGALGLTGWVRNEWDGRVEMEIQGTEAEINRMIQLLHQQSYVDIRGMEMKDIPLEYESGFHIR